MDGLVLVEGRLDKLLSAFQDKWVFLTAEKSGMLLGNITELLTACALKYGKGGDECVQLLYHSNGYLSIFVYPQDNGRDSRQEAHIRARTRGEVIDVDHISSPEDIYKSFTNRKELYGLLIEFGAICRMSPWNCAKQACDELNNEHPGFVLSMSTIPTGLQNMHFNYTIYVADGSGSRKLAYLRKDNIVAAYVLPGGVNLRSETVTDTGNGQAYARDIRDFLSGILETK